MCSFIIMYSKLISVVLFSDDTTCITTKHP